MSKSKKILYDYFIESGKKEIKLLRKHFHIVGSGDNVRVGKEVSPEDVTNFFREYLAKIRPSNLGDEKIFPKPDPSKLRALYRGTPDANILLNIIIRHTLYVDQILIVDPFLTLNFNGPRGVLNKPEIWVSGLINQALCLCALEDWIELGLLLIFPNVFYYHPERLKIPESLQITDKQSKASEEKLIRNMLLGESPENRNSLLDVIARMEKNITDNERAQLLEDVDRYEHENPIRFKLPSNYFRKHFAKSETFSEVHISSSGGLPIIHAPEIATETGSFLIFEHQFEYEILCGNMEQGDKKIDSLQQLSLAFQNLDFPFLHNVPSKKALELREQGYLLSFRIYLRDCWQVITTTNDQQLLDTKIAEFRERLTSEYKILENDWRQIRKDLFTSAVITGAVTGLTVVASGSILLGVVSTLASTTATPASQSIKDLRQTNQKPLAVFLKLAH